MWNWFFKLFDSDSIKCFGKIYWSSILLLQIRGFWVCLGSKFILLHSLAAPSSKSFDLSLLSLSWFAEFVPTPWSCLFCAWFPEPLFVSIIKAQLLVLSPAFLVENVCSKGKCNVNKYFSPPVYKCLCVKMCTFAFQVYTNEL